MNLWNINVIHGLKTAIASVLAYVITIVLNLEFGYWAVLSTVIVMQVYVADSIEMCLYRLSGTVSGALIGVAVLAVTPGSPFFIGLALFITIGICSFLTRYKPRYKMAAITVVIVVMTGAHADNIINFGLSRVSEICIGILCAFAVSVFIFPRRKIDVLKSRLILQAKACSEKCSVLVKAFVLKQKNVEETLMDDLLKDVWENHLMFEKIKQHESLIYHKKFSEKFSEKLILMNNCVGHLRNMVRTLNSLDDVGYDIIMSRELESLAKECGLTLAALIENKPLPDSNSLETIVTELDIKLLNLRKEGLIKRFDSKRLVQVFSFYSSILYYAEDIIQGKQDLQAIS